MAAAGAALAVVLAGCAGSGSGTAAATGSAAAGSGSGSGSGSAQRSGIAASGDAAGALPWLPDARRVSASVPPKLLAVLQAAIERDGAAQAISVCRDEAPKLAQAASRESGWQVRRVSNGPRNPKAVPDAWERTALQDFERRIAAGEPVATIERAEVVVEDGKPVQRYMKPLITQPLCLQCHGKPAELGPGVAQRLGQLYPDDRGTGYAVGQMRGAMTLRRPG